MDQYNQHKWELDCGENAQFLDVFAINSELNDHGWNRMERNGPEWTWKQKRKRRRHWKETGRVTMKELNGTGYKM